MPVKWGATPTESTAFKSLETASKRMEAGILAEAHVASDPRQIVLLLAAFTGLSVSPSDDPEAQRPSHSRSRQGLLPLRSDVK